MTNSVPGFTTTLKTRPLIVAKLEEFIRNKIIKIYLIMRLIYYVFIKKYNGVGDYCSYHESIDENEYL